MTPASVEATGVTRRDADGMPRHIPNHGAGVRTTPPPASSPLDLFVAAMSEAGYPPSHRTGNTALWDEAPTPVPLEVARRAVEVVDIAAVSEFRGDLDSPTARVWSARYVGTSSCGCSGPPRLVIMVTP